MSRRLKTPCATPGCLYETHMGERSYSVSVVMPEGVDLSSLSDQDRDDLDAMIHEHAEYLAWKMIRHSQVRRGDYELGPHLRPHTALPFRSDEDHNAAEIIRRAAARMLADDPSLRVDA